MSLQPQTRPKDGFAGTGGPSAFSAAKTTTHNNSSEVIPVGTKVRLRNNALKEYFTCIYLEYNGGAGSVTIAAGDLVAEYTAAGLGVVTGDDTDIIANGRCAIALSAVTSGNFGWFWCGGCAPDHYSSSGTLFSAESVTTNGSVAAGSLLIRVAGGTDKQVGPATATDVVHAIGKSNLVDTTNDVVCSAVSLFDTWG